MSYIGAQPSDTPSFSHKTFYGFKMDTSTGRVTLHIIDDGSVKIPDSNYILDDDDYKDQFWSQDKLTYAWGTSGHLEVIYQ
jgi:hypothetical protein